MGLFDRFRRRQRLSVDESPSNGSRALPDPGAVPTARGSWEQAALTNVGITELVKRQIGTITPPWKK